MYANDRPAYYIDLFAGCGGISLGLCNSGWRGLFAIEKSPMAFATLKHNLIDNKNHFDWPEWLPLVAHDITEILNNYQKELFALQGKVDLVVGGPPCQGFSFAGRRNKNDKRNQLAKSYVDFIKLVKPKLLLFENVAGFTVGFKNKKGRGKSYSERVKQQLELLGYNIIHKIIDFSEYGIPQRRKRFIMFGVYKESSNIAPDYFFNTLKNNKNNFLANKGLEPTVTLYEALSDLERRNGERQSRECSKYQEGNYGVVESNYQQLMRQDLLSEFPDSHRFAKHNKKTTSRWIDVLANCPKDVLLSQEWKKKFGLKKKSITPLECKSTCPTLTTLPDDYIHYSEPRILTVREYARIQSFPDWFEFKDKYTTGGKRRKLDVPRYTQVGNAVPPLFAEQCGKALEIILNE
jgi:DNA (cytosine-5)-methyltransferase 1